MQFALDFRLSLSEAEEEDLDDAAAMPNQAPPPVPANLARLTPALQAFIDFFEIDPDLVAAAQSISPKAKTATPDFSLLIAGLPETEKNAWLLRLVNVPGFKAKMSALRGQYARKKALIGRFDAVGLY